MPLYEYECQACGHRFEVIQKFSDAPLSVCPKCGGALEKLLSSPAIQFKGSGFYLTDYGRGGKSDMGPGKSAKADAGDKAGTGDKADAPAKSDGAATPATSDSGKAAESKPAAPAAPKTD
jgi:putative FmdB family regulatory protein